MTRAEFIFWGVVLASLYGYALYLKVTEPKP